MLPESITTKIMLNGWTCKICKKNNFKPNQIIPHLNEENISEKDYFDTYIKPNYPEEGICKRCKHVTRFISVTGGYANYCSEFCKNNDFDTDIREKVLI